MDTIDRGSRFRFKTMSVMYEGQMQFQNRQTIWRYEWQD